MLHQGNHPEIDQFRPDNGKDVFERLGGIPAACWFVSRAGSCRPAIRVVEDTTIASDGKPTVLRSGGVVILDRDTGLVVAVQPESFAVRYQRSFSDGESIVPQTADKVTQGRGLMEANGAAQQDLQRIMSASGPRSWFKWKSLRRDRLKFDARGHEVAQHLRDLKSL